MVYMLWLWMETAWDLTFSRDDVGGSYQIGVIGTLGATAFGQVYAGMALEVPLITLAEQMEQAVSGLSCQEIYVNKFKITQFDRLCGANSQFNFADPFKSSFGLTNIYLYNDKFNPSI